jgi:hypothetical protein
MGSRRLIRGKTTARIRKMLLGWEVEKMETRFALLLFAVNDNLPAY